MDDSNTITILIAVAVGQGLTWLLLGWQIWDARRWRADVSHRQLAETTSLLSRLCESQREIAATAEWLKRHEQAVVAAATGGAAPPRVGQKTDGNAIAAGTYNGNGGLGPAAKASGAASAWVGRCIRCATVVRADHRVAYCPPCHRAWVKEGKPGTPERYCAKCGRPAEGITLRRSQCEVCAGPKRPAGAAALSQR
ncbi:hypothetical protein [Nitrospira calida]|jgi:hypothetical protein